MHSGQERPYILPGLTFVDSYMITVLGAADRFYRNGMGAMARQNAIKISKRTAFKLAACRAKLSACWGRFGTGYRATELVSMAEDDLVWVCPDELRGSYEVGATWKMTQECWSA